MPDLKTLSPYVSAAGQVRPEQMASLAAQSFTSVINNRPDDEDPGQPTSGEVEAAALAAGLTYLHAPVRGLPDPQTVLAVADRLKADAASGTRTLMFCRSGMRSAATWAMARRLNGANADDLRQAAADAGYDLSRLPL